MAQPPPPPTGPPPWPAAHGQPVGPPQAGAQALVQPPAPLPLWSGATPYLQTLTQMNQVLSQNFNRVEAFKRAMKVFYLSYPNFDENITTFMNYKYHEYIIKVAGIYGITQVQRQNPTLFSEPLQWAKDEEISICISVKDFVGGNQLQNPRLVCRYQGNQIAYTYLTGPPFAPLFLPSLSFDKYRELRRQSEPPEMIVISIEDNNLVQPIPLLNELQFVVGNTHPEGYEQRFDFGSGVTPLINIELVVRQEKNVVREDVGNFHCRTISLMLGARLRIFNHIKEKLIGTLHQSFSFKHKISFERPFVADPESEDMYWVYSTPDLAPVGVRSHQLLRPLASSPGDQQRYQRTVKFIDINTQFKSNDLKERICLCSEWCNWNAFFHFNPIYRFLLVRHKQLFMESFTNIPDMYLANTISWGSGITAQPKMPILQLINSANENRDLYYKNYIRQTRAFRVKYINSIPDPRLMNAVAYNHLRNDFNIQRLSHQLDVNPFSNICIENLLKYYKVLDDLHIFIASGRQFIADKKLWFKDTDLISRNKFAQFVRYGYVQCMELHAGGQEYLLTPDFEQRLIEEDDAININLIRGRIFGRMLSMNPFNVKIKTNTFLNTFALVYKFLAKVEPMLPKAHKPEAIKKLFECYRDMNNDFVGYQNIGNQNFSFGITEIDVKSQTFEQNFKLFYVLKEYSYWFEFQKHWITSGVNYNKRIGYNSQVSKVFSFCFDNDLIVRSYPTGVAFQRRADFVNVFQEFYTTFYGIPYHESTPLNQIQSFGLIVNSGYEQHMKHFVWLANDGNNRRRFTNIRDNLIQALNQISNDSEQIFTQQILPTIAEIDHPGDPVDDPTRLQVFDHLVHYLGKANCSMFVTTVGAFFKQMHSLQLERLTRDDLSYSLSKPGWVPLFRTMALLMNAVNYVNQFGVVFDDQFNRISETCNQTKKMIKQIYRQFYMKICGEWMNELVNILDKANNNSITVNQGVTVFEVTHFVVGLTFLAAFYKDFRKEFALVRKHIKINFETNTCPQVLTVPAFSAIKRVLPDYLPDKNAIRIANPFEPSLWALHPYLTAIRNTFLQLTPQQFNIDLNAANI